MVPSYHNDVFWFYAHTSFVHGQDNVHCLDGHCRHRFKPTNKDIYLCHHLKVITLISPSVTEYLTPETPDLLDIRLAWQSLSYTDQAIYLAFIIIISHYAESLLLLTREIMSWKQKWDSPLALSLPTGTK